MFIFLLGLQAVNAMSERVQRLNAFFETYRSEDGYDREAITHVMACSSHFPGYLIRSFTAGSVDGQSSWK